MPGLENYSVLVDLYLTTVRYLSRLVVQRQLAAIVLILLAAGMVSTFLMDWGQRRYVRWCWHNRHALLTTRADKDRHRNLRYSLIRTGAIVLQQLTFPLVAITLLLVGIVVFNSFGWLSGLLSRSIMLLFLFTTYRLCMAVLYVFAPRRIAERYQRRLFGPLMFVFMTLLILARLSDLNRLGKVVLFPLFDSPITIGALFLATVGLYFWIDATYGFQDVAQRVIVRRSHLHAGSVEASLTILRYVLVGLGIVAAMSVLGFNPTTVAAITGGLSIGIGFALQDVLKNFFGGLVILFEGTVRPGDYVEVGGKEAVVQKLNIRSTVVRTGDNVEIIVPNQDWLSRSVITYTGTNRRIRLRYPVSVPRSIEVCQVFRVLSTTARKHSQVLADPEPSVTVANFNGANVDYVLTYWIDDAAKMGKVNADMRLMLLEAFENEEVPVS
ncbi:MAG: mechanosensitive ion channel [Caldilineaceae bacterium]